LIYKKHTKNFNDYFTGLLVVDATAERFVVRLQVMGADFDEKNQKEVWSNTIILACIATDRIQGCWSLTQQRKDLLLGYR